MIKTVQDLIDELNKIEDKSLSVCVKDISIDSVGIEQNTNKVFIWLNYERLI